MRSEHWKPVPVERYEARYEISDLGRVRSFVGNRILSPGRQSRGYLTVNLYDGSRPKAPRSYCVHYLVAAAFIGPKPDGKQINHRDGDKTNNDVRNLEYVTGAENVRHAVANGLLVHRVGCEHANAKLTEKQVQQIRSLAAQRPRNGRRPNSLSTEALGRKFGISARAAFDVINENSYRDVS